MKNQPSTVVVQPVYESSSADAAGGQQVRGRASTDAEGLPILYEYDAIAPLRGERLWRLRLQEAVRRPTPPPRKIAQSDSKDFTSGAACWWSRTGRGLFEANWPDRITFLNEDARAPTPFFRMGRQRLLRAITEGYVADVLGANQVELNFDFGYEDGDGVGGTAWTSSRDCDAERALPRRWRRGGGRRLVAGEHAAEQRAGGLRPRRATSGTTTSPTPCSPPW